MSSIREWHIGKIVILWGVCAVWFWLLTEAGSQALALAWLAFLVFCVAVTWIWLSGREGKR